MKVSGIIAGLSLLAYPLLEHLADIERGYNSNVFGGEELALLFGVFIIPALIVSWGEVF